MHAAMKCASGASQTKLQAIAAEAPRAIAGSEERAGPELDDPIAARGSSRRQPSWGGWFGSGSGLGGGTTVI